MKTLGKVNIGLKHIFLILTAIVMLSIFVLSAGVCTQTTLANGNSVVYTYDDAGRLTEVEYPNGATIDYTYDAMGNLLERNVTSGEWSPWIYDVSPKDFVIQVGEFLGALADYLDSNILVTQLLEVLGLYLNP